MKKNRLTILLIVAVVAIWALIAYKIYMSVHIKPIAPSSHLTVERPLGNESIGYTISNYARDPFLSIITDTAEIVEEPEVRKSLKPPVLPRYCGLVQNSDRKKIAILHVNKRYMFLAQGEKDGDLILKAIGDDNIEIKMNGEIYKITLSTK